MATFRFTRPIDIKEEGDADGAPTVRFRRTYTVPLGRCAHAELDFGLVSGPGTRTLLVEPAQSTAGEETHVTGLAVEGPFTVIATSIDGAPGGLPYVLGRPDRFLRLDVRFEPARPGETSRGRIRVTFQRSGTREEGTIRLIGTRVGLDPEVASRHGSLGAATDPVSG